MERKQSDASSELGPEDFAKAELTEDSRRRFVEDARLADKWTVLVAGKVGAGKSTLLNGIVGETLFEEGRDRSVHQTSDVEYRKMEKNGVTVTAWDSPGLQDDTGRESEYLENLRKNCKNVDLMLYCVSMKETRFDERGTATTIKNLTEALGRDIWKRSMVVLTFANFVEERLIRADSKSAKGEFETLVYAWKAKLLAALRNASVPEDIVTKLPVHPAGVATKQSLPNREFWLSDIWVKALTASSKRSQPAILKVAQGRLKRKSEVTTAQLTNPNLAEQPIVLTKKNMSLKTKILIGVGAGSGVTVGIAAGATVGALIGALAIGIPTFGVAAGVGLGLGGVIGGSIGAGVATGVTAAVVKKKQKESTEN